MEIVERKKIEFLPGPHLGASYSPLYCPDKTKRYIDIRRPGQV
jgi:hypothetical protein